MTDTVTPVELSALLDRAEAAAAPLADSDPRDRARALVAVAGRLDDAADELIPLAIAETGLAEGRLRGEIRRTTSQLRLFAEVIAEGAYLDARIDEADPDYVIGPRPDVRRVNVPIGPVLIFAASNFPFAFSVAGGDTAAALAAANPVVLKAHEGHPRLSRATAEIVDNALTAAGLPGAFNLIETRDDGITALRDQRVRAAAFTGSTATGRALAEIAAGRTNPIPFFGELGSVNPVFVTEAALRKNAAQIAEGYVASVTGSCGQLCTKPGFLFVPSHTLVADHIVDAAAEVGEHRELTPGITTGYLRRRDAVMSRPDVTTLVSGDVRVDDDGFGWATPAFVATSIEALVSAGGELLDEAFGPLSVIVEYDDAAALPELARRLFPGNLTATVHSADGEDSPELAALVRALVQLSGRVLFGGWPTGVSVTAAMQHGGPYPATTVDSTSVGTAAIGRFLRAVAYQNAPESLLPPPLRDDNPWQIPQRRSIKGLSAQWGSLSGRY
ncbi:aldehyde dehydrogenase family protein [Mycobacterium sp. URHB0021]